MEHVTRARAPSERLCVLVVEDNAADAELVREMLLEASLVAAGAVTPEIHRVETLRAALAAAKQPFDVALLDLGLPDASGLEGLSALNAAVPDLPAVVLTGARDPTLAARALVAGAQDFLVKSEVQGDLLLHCLRFAVARQRRAALGAAEPVNDCRRGDVGHAAGSPASIRRVLLVEDNPGDADLVRIALSQGSHGFAVDHVERLDDALTYLTHSDVDAVLLDLALPDAQGMECVEKIRSAFPDLPVVVLTGNSSAGLEAVRAGVQDYAIKGELAAHDLQRTIDYSIERNAHGQRVRELAAERAAHAATEAAARTLRDANEHLGVATRKAHEALEREAAARAQAEHRTEEIEALFESMIDPVLVYAEDGRIESTNPAATTFFGRDVRGLLPAGLIDAADVRSSAGARITVPTLPASRALEGAVVAAEKLRLRTPAGERVVLVSASPVRRGDAVRGAVCVYRDVTALDRAQQALRDSERRYRALFENMREGFVLDEIVRDEKGNPSDVRYLEVNPAFERHTGLRAADVVGRTMYELFPDAEPEWVERYGNVAVTGEPVHFEAKFGPLGRWFEVGAHRTESGRVAVVFSDITSRKHAEEALREADRNKGEFLTVLSHELRNPLAPILNSLYILGRVESSSAEAERAKKVIERQVGTIARLVDDLLDVSRISRGKIELRRSLVDLTALVRHIGDDHRGVAQQHELELAVETPPRAVWVDADATRLTQMIGNLLHNAGKFTRAGGRVTLGLRDEHGTAVVAVRDTGIGIEPDRLEHLFQPFYQAHGALARSNGGLGLGLALVKGIAELHGGSVRAASRGPGHGAEFLVTLPVEDPPSEQVAPRQLEEAPAPVKRRACRVLVVDDNPDVAQTMAEIVAVMGHSVEIAHDGRAALEKAKANPPDIIFCDIGMAGMDGFDVARAVRADDSLRHVQLVALTGYADPEDRERAAQAGFDAHVTKPHTPEQIERLLSSR